MAQFEKNDNNRKWLENRLQLAKNKSLPHDMNDLRRRLNIIEMKIAVFVHFGSMMKSNVLFFL